MDKTAKLTEKLFCEGEKLFREGENVGYYLAYREMLRSITPLVQAVGYHPEVTEWHGIIRVFNEVYKTCEAMYQALPEYWKHIYPML